MKTVDVDRSLCDNHGQCAIAAPEVFRMNPDGVLEYEPTFDDSLLGEVEEAIDVCPVQAIFLKD
ncbi:ferredoxin [Arthrobacter sulfonylureivorans]|uniref:Ferredoxin n=1 Tax=Arthrobacter sulfonylureivorans TaxID=2486855 RepID=A0ABY3WA32_9MICC|nr:ferredoxin [Arthrobacter sulfonylureivorans]UNK45182.1 ferredoxin [Arthrobacter sulfonylureivorans]